MVCFGPNAAAGFKFGNFLRTLATPEPIMGQSLTSPKETLINMPPSSPATRPVFFQMTDVAIPR